MISDLLSTKPKNWPKKRNSNIFRLRIFQKIASPTLKFENFLTIFREMRPQNYWNIIFGSIFRIFKESSLGFINLGRGWNSKNLERRNFEPWKLIQLAPIHNDHIQFRLIMTHFVWVIWVIRIGDSLLDSKSILKLYLTL